MKNKKGFTLIEVLIVISIIGILASIVLVNLGGFRARGRDARRIADVRSVQNALELYYGANGFYPNAAGDGGGGGSPVDWATLESHLKSVGVDKLPKSPSGPQYQYGSDGDQQGYVLQTVLENDNPVLKESQRGDVNGVPCGTTGGLEYCVKF